jgi:hypothetical protein
MIELLSYYMFIGTPIPHNQWWIRTYGQVFPALEVVVWKFVHSLFHGKSRIVRQLLAFASASRVFDSVTVEENTPVSIGATWVIYHLFRITIQIPS